MRSAADMEEVGCPEPAAVLQRIESTRSCCATWRANSRSVVAIVSVTAMALLGTTSDRPLRGASCGSGKSLSAVRSRARELFDFGHHAVEDLQSRVPEARVGDVHADPLNELVRSRRAAGREEVQVPIDEARTELQIAVVDRK